MTSRSKRWAEAATKAVEGLSELNELREEYEEWMDNLPEHVSAVDVAVHFAETLKIELVEGDTTKWLKITAADDEGSLLTEISVFGPPVIELGDGHRVACILPGTET